MSFVEVSVWRQAHRGELWVVTTRSNESYLKSGPVEGTG